MQLEPVGQAGQGVVPGHVGDPVGRLPGPVTSEPTP